jgi:hypothetical protein
LRGSIKLCSLLAFQRVHAPAASPHSASLIHQQQHKQKPHPSEVLGLARAVQWL